MNGTATKLKKNATPREIAQAALEIWKKRQETAATTGKKLQQGPFTVKVEDGPTYLVRPTVDALVFYAETPELRVNFQRTVRVEIRAEQSK